MSEAIEPQVYPVATFRGNVWEDGTPIPDFTTYALEDETGVQYVTVGSES